MKGVMFFYQFPDGELDSSKLFHWPDETLEDLFEGMLRVGIEIATGTPLVRYRVISIHEWESSLGLVDVVIHRQIADN